MHAARNTNNATTSRK